MSRIKDKGDAQLVFLARAEHPGDVAAWDTATKLNASAGWNCPPASPA
ncbi:hypothetical protein [Mycobacterium sp. 141]|nr:hypothetical protein [Mycobacterium sp. 141]